MDEALYSWLKEHQIEYKLHTHPAVFTVEEARIHCGFIPGMHCKNLFLKNVKGTAYYLVTVPSAKRLDFKKLQNKLNSSLLKFASEDELKKYLELGVGAVSPLGLVNDKQKNVVYVIDREVWNAEILSFHPNVNNESIEITKENFHKMIKFTGNRFQVLEI